MANIPEGGNIYPLTVYGLKTVTLSDHIQWPDLESRFFKVLHHVQSAAVI